MKAERIKEIIIDRLKQGNTNLRLTQFNAFCELTEIRFWNNVEIMTTDQIEAKNKKIKKEFESECECCVADFEEEVMDAVLLNIDDIVMTYIINDEGKPQLNADMMTCWNNTIDVIHMQIYDEVLPCEEYDGKYLGINAGITIFRRDVANNRFEVLTEENYKGEEYNLSEYLKQFAKYFE